MKYVYSIEKLKHKIKIIIFLLLDNKSKKQVGNNNEIEIGIVIELFITAI